MKYKKTALILLLAGILLSGCSSQTTNAFKEEHESLNNEKTSSGKDYMDVTIPDDHRFVYAEEDALLELLQNGTGVVYFGFPQCPWCRNAVPVIDEAAKAVNLEEIYYLNVYDIRDKKSLDSNGTIVTETEGSDLYNQILDILGDTLPEYQDLGDPSLRRIYVPLVMVIVEGEVVASHLSTVDSQEDPYVPLTQEQHDELYTIYTEMFSNIPGCGPQKYLC